MTEHRTAEERAREIVQGQMLRDSPELVQAITAAITAAERGQPDDIRALGWVVAVHNDYRLNGEAHTFWLFTKDGRAVKGEGRTDAEALVQVRALVKETE